MTHKTEAEKAFPQVPGPFRRVSVQSNGDLAIIRDSRNRYWLVNVRHRRVYPETFATLKAAQSEASSVTFVADPSSPTPEWTEVRP